MSYPTLRNPYICYVVATPHPSGLPPKAPKIMQEKIFFDYDEAVKFKESIDLPCEVFESIIDVKKQVTK